MNSTEKNLKDYARLMESHIAVLQENARLREAMEPFARDAVGIHPDWSDERRRASLTQEKPLTVGDFRKAREALAAAKAVDQSVDANKMLQPLDLQDRLVAISSAVADGDDRAAQSMLRETLKLLAVQPQSQVEARACEIFSMNEWCLWPLDHYEEAKARGWQVRKLVVERANPQASGARWMPIESAPEVTND